MKILIVTVAGMATRFSESVGYDCLKCLYQSNTFPEALLPRLLRQASAVDRIIIVGGFRYSELCEKVAEQLPHLMYKITLVENKHYADFGSAYSLYLGLRAAMEYPFDHLIFAEGDLFLDGESFERIVNADTDVVTINSDPVVANKSVAFYYDTQEKLHYIYDTAHHALRIAEPFLGIYNSGQVWKFCRPELLRSTVKMISDQEWEGTNLILVQKYFGNMKKRDYLLLPFRKWINCNTAEDLLKILEE